MSSKTDRALIAMALIVLLLTLGGIFAFDSIFRSDDRMSSDQHAIAEIIGRKGDVRVKYHEEFRWQNGQLKQGVEALQRLAGLAGERQIVG